MLFRGLSLSFFISLGILLSVGGTPVPPLRHISHETSSGVQHAWHAWEPGASPSSLPAYAKAVYDEMSQEAARHDPRIGTKDQPTTMASLWVKDKGVYSASDLGHVPRLVTALLHPKTSALLNRCSRTPARYGGTRYGASCSCIQAIDGFHTAFPSHDIPPGSKMAIHGCRCGHRRRPERMIEPCRAGGKGPGCATVLSAAGIGCEYDPDAPKGSESRKRPRLIEGVRPNPNRCESDENRLKKSEPKLILESPQEAFQDPIHNNSIFDSDWPIDCPEIGDLDINLDRYIRLMELLI